MQGTQAVPVFDTSYCILTDFFHYSLGSIQLLLCHPRAITRDVNKINRLEAKATDGKAIVKPQSLKAKAKATVLKAKAKKLASRPRPTIPGYKPVVLPSSIKMASYGLLVCHAIKPSSVRCC